MKQNQSAKHVDVKTGMEFYMAIFELLNCVWDHKKLITKDLHSLVVPVNARPRFTTKLDAVQPLFHHFHFQSRPRLHSGWCVCSDASANGVSCGRQQSRLTWKSVHECKQHDSAKVAVLPHLFFSFSFSVSYRYCNSLLKQKQQPCGSCASLLNIPSSTHPALSHPLPSAVENGTIAAPDPVRDCCGLDGQKAVVGWWLWWWGAEGGAVRSSGARRTKWGWRVEVGSGVHFEAVGLSALVGNWSHMQVVDSVARQIKKSRPRVDLPLKWEWGPDIRQKT